MTLVFKKDLLTSTYLMPLIEERNIRVFPNPASGGFTIEGSEQIERIVVRDWSNRQVIEKWVNSTLAYIDAEHLISGYYTVEIYSHTNGLLGVKKLILQQAQTH